MTVGSETVSISRDGRYASWAWPGTVVVVERDSGVVHRTEAFVPRTPVGGTRAVSAFTAAEHLLIGNLDGDVWEVAPTTFTEIAHWSVPAGYTESGMAATADGTVYASGHEGIIATDATGRELWRHRLSARASVPRIAASSSSGFAACGDENGTFQVATSRPARSSSRDVLPAGCIRRPRVRRRRAGAAAAERHRARRRAGARGRRRACKPGHRRPA